MSANIGFRKTQSSDCMEEANLKRIGDVLCNWAKTAPVGRVWARVRMLSILPKTSIDTGDGFSICNKVNICTYYKSRKVTMRRKAIYKLAS